MKKVLVVISIIVVAISLMPFALDKNEEMRGLWVASVINLDYPQKPSTNPDQLKAEADRILDKAQEVGFNAIFLQVRPTGDALYNSKIFPYSKYLTGVEAKAPEAGFDPLAYWVEAAHKRGMELHAWVNPYRVSKKTYKDAAVTTDSLSPKNPARLHASWVIQHSDGNLYYDPALPEVRNLIVLGVEEIIVNYKVDGIHFDDYFYPSPSFNDAVSYQRYGKGKEINTWRRENVNQMLRDVRQKIKSHDKNIQFGVSPFGIWANKSSHSKGSQTRGKQSYFDHYADSLKWIDEGIVDYIVPQLYWSIGYDVADYQVLLDWWQEAVKNSPVKLYIGQGAYRVNNDAKSVWFGSKELLKQLSLNKKHSEVDGSIFFRAGSFENQRLSKDIAAYYGGGKTSNTVVRKEKTPAKESAKAEKPQTKKVVAKATAKANVPAKPAAPAKVKKQKASVKTQNATKTSSWAAKDINALATKKLLDEDFFQRYLDSTTRADFAYLGVELYQKLHGKEVVVGDESFSDTNDAYVLKAKKIGIVSGYPDGSFRPNKPITRQELAVVFINTLEKSGIKFGKKQVEKFADDAKIGDWAKDKVYLAKTHGIIYGELYNSFNPLGTATREQSMVLYKRILDKFMY